MSAFSNPHTCPTCLKTWNLIIQAQAISRVCPHCHSLFILRGKNRFESQKKLDSSIHTSKIPLGSKGILRGTNYEVCGFSIKAERGSPNYAWREYMLFNPELGYASLSEYNGHWGLFEELNEFPRIKTNSTTHDIAYQERSFQLFSRYRFNVLKAEGEFPFDLSNTDCKIFEFISPPYTLVNEVSDDSNNWYLGEYINKSEIEKAFQVTALPQRLGVGAAQPLAGNFKAKEITTISAVFVFLAALLQAAFGYMAAEEVVFSHTYYRSEMDTSKTIRSGSFHIQHDQKALELILFSPLNNNWLDVDAELINEETGERFEALKSLEFYSGYDEGYWTEGDKEGSVVLSSVPKGRYHFNFYPDFGSPGGLLENDKFTVEAKSDVPLFSNLLWLILFASLVPIFAHLREYYLEYNRWANSDFSPYHQE
ncbi:MAG: DUF4178 domain-containing protein [Bacteroidia bacterium]|nr:DUF4178 domain-containing protein [Bacteroidia bacterium]